tara:strand:+ start:41 stop:349 length:309 start_codon:yes stop_codon:yes gene_type:complete
MSADRLVCGICNEAFSDYGVYYQCAKCEDNVCESCYGDQLEEYGSVEEGSEGADWFGNEALAECGSCTEYEIRDEDIMLYLLAKVGMTKEEVVVEIKNIKPE